MKLCVLLPDYSTSTVDYRHYDPPRDVARWIPEHEVHTIFLHKLSTYQQLRDSRSEGYDCYVNLCEGYLEWDVPSIDVIHTLEMLDLPFSGPTSVLYDPPKSLMKYVAFCSDVRTPEGCVVERDDDVLQRTSVLRSRVGFPLFVKPAKAGDSLGIDERSCVNTDEELVRAVMRVREEFPEVLVERYVDGREFTVLVSGNSDGATCTVYRPLEYRFHGGDRFKTYALKTRELHADCNVPCDDADLDVRLRDAARRIFEGFSGQGYARMDFRVEADGTIVFLEVNFTCSVFYTDGYEGSADHILLSDEHGHRGFLLNIIAEGIARHRRHQRSYCIRETDVHGYGMFATRDIPQGEVVYRGEERAHRIVSKWHVEQHWSEEQQEVFRRYAYPISDEVYILWDERPENWAPQNHSCDATTRFDGLDVVAARDVRRGEELTLDYADMLDESAEPFTCSCGAPSCRGLIRGVKGSSISAKESALRSERKR